MGGFGSKRGEVRSTKFLCQENLGKFYEFLQERKGLLEWIREFGERKDMPTHKGHGPSNEGKQEIQSHK